MRLFVRGFALLVLAAMTACGAETEATVDTAANSDTSIDCPDRPRPPAQEGRPNTLGLRMLYPSLDELTGASEIVVLGEVSEVGRGEVSGAEPGLHGGYQSMSVTLNVKEVYRGPVSDETVVFNEAGWSLGPPEQPTIEAGIHRSQVGDCGFYFLSRGEPGSQATALSLTSIQGRFIAEGEDEVFAGYEQSNPLSDELAAMSFSELRVAVQEAAERMKEISAREVHCSQPGPRPAGCEPAGEDPAIAANALYDAWEADDREAAADYGSPAAIEELWKERWAAPGYDFVSCNIAHSDMGYPSPAPPAPEPDPFEARCEFRSDESGVIQMAFADPGADERTITAIRRSPTDVGWN